MAAEFTTTGDWHGTLNIGFETAQKVAGKPALVAGYLYKRQIYRIDRKRFGQELTGFPDSVGGTALGSALYVANGGDKIYGSSLQTYVLTVDYVTPSPTGTGIWEETQSMVSYEDWEVWEIPVTPPAP